MATIKPSTQTRGNSSGDQDSSSAYTSGGLWNLFNRVKNKWLGVQVYNLGSYSIERLQLFHDYCINTSRLRVTLVCIASPLPTLAMILLMELIDLQDPYADWKEHLVIYCRTFFWGIAILAGAVYQYIPFDFPSQPSPLYVVICSVIYGASYFALFVAMAAYWVFPVPFGFIIVSHVCAPICVLMMVGGIGIDAIKKNKKKVKSMVKQVCLAGCLTPTYSMFNAFFQTQESVMQTLLIFVLPLIKLMLKNAMVKVNAALGDVVLETVVFTVELFNALYISTCMQTANSPLTVFIVIFVDAGQSLLSIIEIWEYTKNVPRPTSSSADGKQFDLVKSALCLCQDPLVLDKLRAKGVRFTSKQELVKPIEWHNKRLPSRTSLDLGSTSAPMKSTSIVPEPISTDVVPIAKQSMPTYKVDTKAGPVAPGPVAPGPDFSMVMMEQINKWPVEKKAKMVGETLQLMFHTEYLICVEYIESIIPVVYISYMSTLFQLPNAQYYPYSRNMTSDDLRTSAITLLLYAFLEGISMIVLSFILKRRFGYSSMHLLAFMLERHFNQIQGRFFSWIPLILQFTLVHYGTDYSFEFPWMKQALNSTSIPTVDEGL